MAEEKNDADKTYWLDIIEEAGTKASYAIDYPNEGVREVRKWFFVSLLKEALLKEGYKPKRDTFEGFVTKLHEDVEPSAEELEFFSGEPSKLPKKGGG